MVNLKKYLRFQNHFVLLLTFLSLVSCAEKKYFIKEIHASQVNISDKNASAIEYESFIEPYKKNIDEDLNTVLAYSPNTLDKSGVWQSTLGNLQSDITLEAANKIFNMRTGKKVSVCLLNSGGIRSAISKGNVTTRTGFELMPFENNLVVVEMKGSVIIELIEYFIKERKPHPLSGLTFTIANNTYESIKIQNQPIDLEATYYIATNDYLYNGGDRMNFFKKATKVYDLDYKIRNVWIDYFKQVDTIPLINTTRIFTK